ncbi:SMI1/KNR4 family protein [Dactylosporangium sp. NPDC000521]|uniref:SMI1/KNR4 family protein n=1 Tax=Dactylosporangium sp. NPDC000521 TaxID=3363975 RepID=UPI00367720D8
MDFDAGCGSESGPVTVEDLDAVEARLGVALPGEYRAFMLAFGAELESGWGGLLRPSRLPGVNRPDTTASFEHVRRPFTMVDGICASMYDQHEDEDECLVDGALIIAEHGCTFCTIMVVTGEHVGTVWKNDWSRQGRQNEYTWLPSCNMSSHPCSCDVVGAPVMFQDWVGPRVNLSSGRRKAAARRSAGPGLLGRLRRLRRR